MGRGSICPNSAVVLYGRFDRGNAGESELFTTSFEGKSYEIHDLASWLDEQQQFDSPRDCWEILAELVKRGSAVWAEVRYDVVDVERLEHEFKALPEPPES